MRGGYQLETPRRCSNHGTIVGLGHEQEAETRFPTIKDWELYFDTRDGLSNRLKVVQNFVLFWNYREKITVEPKGVCFLGGLIYNSDIYQDREEIFTTKVLSFEKIDVGGNEDHPCDTIVFHTAGSGDFICYSNQRNDKMSLLISDIIQNGSLKDRAGHYLPLHLRDTCLGRLL